MNLDAHYSVTVETILPIGAVVRMDDGSTELVHISQISDTFIDDVSNFVSVGDMLDAVCVKGTDKKPLQLSFKHLKLRSKVSSVKAKSWGKNNRNNADNTNKSNKLNRSDIMELPNKSDKNYHNSTKPKKVEHHPSQLEYAATLSKSSDENFEAMLKKAQSVLSEKTNTRSNKFGSKPVNRRRRVK